MYISAVIYYCVNCIKYNCQNETLFSFIMLGCYMYVYFSCLFLLSEKSLFPSKACSVGMDYTEIEHPTLEHDSVHKFDEVFLLPREQTVHNSTSVDGSVRGSPFDELDWLVHIDTDMSSLLHVVDGQLAENSHRSSAFGDTAGDSWVDSEQLGGRDSAAMSESPYHLPYDHRQSGNDSASPAFHEYDLVYVPHEDAAGMAQRIDSETSYVRTLRSRQNLSPYEEVCYGIRPLLLSDRLPAQFLEHNPVVPPRTSSIANSHWHNSDSGRVTVECTGEDCAKASDLHGELSHQTSTVSDVDTADDDLCESES